MRKQMPRPSINTRINLEQAVAQVLQVQASFLKLSVESELRFRRIERDLDQIKAMLSELPEAVRLKIGFKVK